MNKKKKIKLSTTHVVLLSFLLTILTGSLLLSLPFSAADGVSVGYIDALFTATTATCVTGLVTLTTATAWSFFGQLVILLLIQIGGLGLITLIAAVFSLMQKRMRLGHSLLIQDAFNLNTLSDLGTFVKKVIAGTLIIEGVGALLYMTVFVPDFGAKGIWISIFNSVSAFCNAGMDIIGETSLMNYAGSFTVNFVTCALIITGGIGFIVWWDIIGVLRRARKEGFACLRRLSLHSKIALSTTAVLIALGAVLIFIFEYNNPNTIGNMSFFDKVMASVFQSVTTRTAGFCTVGQDQLTGASVAISTVLMFIGGSPVGTAGGIKTVTVAVMLATAYSSVRGRRETSLFARNISQESVKKAVAVFSMSFCVMMLSTVLLSLCCNAPLTDIVYETVSATATVGLTRNLTSTLNVFGKLIITVTMYFGRIGPISLAVALNRKGRIENIIKNPEEEISVG